MRWAKARATAEARYSKPFAVQAWRDVAPKAQAAARGRTLRGKARNEN